MFSQTTLLSHYPYIMLILPNREQYKTNQIGNDSPKASRLSRVNTEQKKLPIKAQNPMLTNFRAL